MKLLVGFTDGTILTVDGSYDEITSYGDKLIREHGTQVINLEEAKKLGGQMIHVKAPPVWTEQSVKNLLGLIYGDQEKLLKYLVGNGGTATYEEVGKHMGYNGQRLSGILSPLARNAKSAMNNDSAKIIDWRPSQHPGERIYFVNAEALPLLKDQMNK